MSKLVSLRLYFHHAEKVQPSRKLHRFFRPSLATHLLHHAEKAGIEQVILHDVRAGYLKGKGVIHRHVESAHPHLPHCIELIDLETKLRDFVKHQAEHLSRVRAIFLPCESALEA